MLKSLSLRLTIDIEVFLQAEGKKAPLTASNRLFKHLFLDLVVNSQLHTITCAFLSPNNFQIMLNILQEVLGVFYWRQKLRHWYLKIILNLKCVPEIKMNNYYCTKCKHIANIKYTWTYWWTTNAWQDREVLERYLVMNLATRQKTRPEDVPKNEIELRVRAGEHPDR